MPTRTLVLFAAIAGVLTTGCAGAATRPTPEPVASDPNDRCPDAYEDEDGFEDDDGCPDPDNDGDAVADIDDLCQCNVEDVDGWQDADGCPDPDDDDDRILDACDRCPRDVEVYNGTCDEDGCPDRGAVVLIETRILILDRIGFARGRSIMNADDAPILQAVAATLIGNPQLERVAIVGHAHRTERRPEALATARATAIVDALVAAGVARERLLIEAAPPESDDDRGYHARFVAFVIMQVDGVPFPNGEPPAGWGRPPPQPRHPMEPATCDPLPACTYVEVDACAPRPASPDAPTAR